MNTAEFDPLQAFAQWWVSQQAFMLPPSIHDGVTHLDNFTGLVLYRGGAFQVQLWICKPNSVITEHSHPNVDSIVVYVSGQVYFTKNGEPPIPQVFQLEDGRSSENGATQRIKPTDTHGARVGFLGGSFLVIQHWLDGNPRSTELDWDGLPLDEGHKLSLAGRNDSPSQS